jgi:hypothetical protein
MCKNEPWPAFGPGTVALPGHEAIANKETSFYFGPIMVKYPKVLPVIPSDELWVKFESHPKHSMYSYSLKNHIGYPKKYLYIFDNQEAQDLL